MQLFCFSHAGGSASFYDALSECLKPDIKLISLEYAGHGSRQKESLCLNMDEMITDLCMQLYDRYDKNDEIALMGYSMGTIVVMALYDRLSKQKCLPPFKQIFLAAHCPVTQKNLAQFIDPCMKDYVKEYVVKFGGIPRRLLSRDVFWRMYLPIYQADFHIIGEFEFEKQTSKINVPTTLFFSDSDTPRDKMELWGNYLSAGFDMVEYEGNHFFINENYKHMAGVIRKKCL